MTVAVAGATGRLGREVVHVFKANGYRVRALGRDRSRLESTCESADDILEIDFNSQPDLRRALNGVDWTVSCVGASVIPLSSRGAKTFNKEDYPANRSLIEAARSEGTGCFLYISVFGADRLPHMEFVRAHEQVVEELRTSNIPHIVVRPTGFYASMREILVAANRGILPECRQGAARTNPIHEHDLARFCLEKMEGFKGPCEEYDVGGPDVLTRREIAELAHRLSGRYAIKAPVWTLNTGALILRPFNPRVSHLMLFISAILKDDYVAPGFGEIQLADYLKQEFEPRQAYSVT